MCRCVAVLEGSELNLMKGLVTGIVNGTIMECNATLYWMVMVTTGLCPQALNARWAQELPSCAGAGNVARTWRDKRCARMLGWDGPEYQSIWHTSTVPPMYSFKEGLWARISCPLKICYLVMSSSLPVMHFSMDKAGKRRVAYFSKSAPSYPCLGHWSRFQHF